MRNSCRRSGSALIIVLGFLSFMIVSAVSFAVYMRTERISSSGFHRSASVRQMVKAGVANAIAQLDFALGDAPAPGISIDNNYDFNRFDGFVFSPTWPSDGLDHRQLTARVLPLEGLAYLPPAIVNEVRMAARTTPSAQWQRLDYDVGRFAYVAVNVSDFFDVNKVRFGRQRNTGPGGRIAPTHLFQNEKGDGLDVSASQLKNFDEFLKTRGNKESSVPFVSLADFNVALYTRDKTGNSLGVYSPFYRYLEGGTARAFYGFKGDEDDNLVKIARRMLFTTDSWQLPTNSVDSVIDLAREDDQPFKKTAFNANKIIGPQLLQGTGRAYNDRLKDEICFTTLANLYDYLDDNSVPISLAIPNVERVPMISSVDLTGIAGALQVTLKGEKKDEDYNKGGAAGQGATYIKETATYSLVPKLEAPLVNLVCMYPFKGKTTREGEKSKKSSCKVQVIAKIFLAKAGQNAGAGWSGRCMKNTNITPSKNEWDTGEKATVANNCITLISSKTNIPDFPDEVLEENKAIFDVVVKLPSLAAVNNDLANMYLLQTQKLFNKQNGIKGTEVKGVDGYPKASTFRILPFKGDLPHADGAQIVTTAGNDPELKSENEVPLEDAKCWNVTLTPQIAVWARIIDEQGKTVDLAPATMYDDALNNTAAGAAALAATGPFGDASQHSAMLLAPGTTQIEFSDAKNARVSFTGAAESAAPFSGTAAAFIALDPRFNASPEDYIARTTSFTKNEYLQEIKNLLGKDGRDADVFMFASDQEYLQSIGELAFLPKLGELGDENAAPYGICTTPLPFRTNFGDMDPKKCHCRSFWRTYPLFKLNGDGYQPDDYLFKYFSSQIEAGDKVIVSDLNGYKVSPYATVEKIRLAVTANTPHSFWASSTNTALSANLNPPPCFTGPGQPKPMDECLKYCFNEMPGNVGPEVSWQDMTNITARLFNQMRSDAIDRVDWEDSLASMDWYLEGNPNRIFGYDLLDSDELHSVDRKTMYSFWHDSMAHRQQLFLVFVRVEPVPPGANETRTQKSIYDENKVQSYGGRAVALVWRDPQPSVKAQSNPVQFFNVDDGSGTLFSIPRSTGSEYVPHRTRLLFYHQFD